MLSREKVFDPSLGRWIIKHRSENPLGSRDASGANKYVGTHRWKRLRLRVFERDGYACQGERCQRLPPVRRLVRLGAKGCRGTACCDHVVPVWQGGEIWDIDNLQTLCVACHIEKTKLENQEFVVRHGVQVMPCDEMRGKRQKRLQKHRVAMGGFLDDLLGKTERGS